MIYPISFLLITVATVTVGILLVAIAKRVLAIKLFRYRCDLAFYKAVLSSNTLSKGAKNMANDYYQWRRPSLIRLFFSRKETIVVDWFSTDDIAMLFIPECECNKPKKNSNYGLI